MKRRLKINGFIMLLATLLIVLFPTVFLRKSSLTFSDEVREIIGIFFMVLGLLLRASSRGYKSEHSQNGASLVQGGPYLLVRNPMYLGILLIGLGIVLVLFNWWITAIFLCVFIWRYLILIFKEEKKLMHTFPKEYGDYRVEVPRLLPSPIMLWQQDIAEYLPLKVSWLKKEIGTILAVLFGVLFVESWEDIRSEGLTVYFKESIAMLMVVVLFLCLVVYLTKRTEYQHKYVANKNKTN